MNLFSNLVYSDLTPTYLSIAVFFFAVFAVLPVVVRQQLFAKYFIYIGGVCEVPCNYFNGIFLPWILAILLYHIQLFGYLINWTSLLFSLFIYFVAPMFLYTKSIKEAMVYETNFKQSLEMIYEGDKVSKKTHAKNLGNFLNVF
mmetsp:Transcript_25459/g.24789  ORF Transcript_25459/g.24789 Transcript_25459/m.24789 type:complete len:144 (-) Transcript_25459:391-822(-)